MQYLTSYKHDNITAQKISEEMHSVRLFKDL